ncbi:hypothetical protein KJ682_07680 [bacterium]|nr:hypothetical protein [bacterium]
MMRKWLYDRPWIWIVVFLGALVLGSLATVIIAEMNRPEIVRPRDGSRPAPTTMIAS